jgi:hypothetical protein
MQFILLEYLPAAFENKFRVRNLEAPSKKDLTNLLACEKSTDGHAHQIWSPSEWSEVLSTGQPVIDLSKACEDIPPVADEAIYEVFSAEDLYSDNQYFLSPLFTLENEEHGGTDSDPLDPIRGDVLASVKLIPADDAADNMWAYYLENFAEKYADNRMDNIMAIYRPKAFKGVYGLVSFTESNPLEGIEVIAPCQPTELVTRMKAWALTHQL